MFVESLSLLFRHKKNFHYATTYLLFSASRYDVDLYGALAITYISLIDGGICYRAAVRVNLNGFLKAQKIDI